MPTLKHPSLPNLELVFVEGGEFSMGNNKGQYDWEKPEHPVKLSPYYIGKYPVTQRLWEAVMGDNPSGFKGDRRPVENVSWNDADEFIKKLNAKNEVLDWSATQKLTGHAFRLPTEAQWEFAARGGKYSQQYKYAGSDKLRQVGWYDANSHNETKEVGLLLPNELGIYDMSGNVWEWCRDWYSNTYFKECLEGGQISDPPGPESGIYRVDRGGSYFFNESYCRPSFRFRYSPEDRNANLGFRLVFSLQ
ncbi:MAG TPA: formylglycine-generating enzyme family protein [Flavilitoribacter sp.]|nr:formylglycine-generating enzyme family protein [Flavilitoribacter sp.]HMQ86893.1 formylglycine-generating enzyme family protein [Flavilitoribacter sp.]